MSIAAHWTPDCQGKEDFDGPIVVVSCRFWPPSHVHRDSKPSAHCSIILRDREEDHDMLLADQTFDGETTGEVKFLVETWANSQRDRIIRALEREFFDERKGQG